MKPIGKHSRPRKIPPAALLIVAGAATVGVGAGAIALSDMQTDYIKKETPPSSPTALAPATSTSPTSHPPAPATSTAKPKPPKPSRHTSPPTRPSSASAAPPNSPKRKRSSSPSATRSRATTRPSITSSTSPTRTSARPSVKPPPPPTASAKPKLSTTSPTATPVPATPAPDSAPANWYQSDTALVQAQQMDAAEAVNSTNCSLAASGAVNLDLVPTGIPVGVGVSGDYTCLIWK